MVEIPLDDETIFCIDSTEVTNEQYKVFLDAMPALDGQVQGCGWNNSYEPAMWPVPEDKGDHPVVQVDWCDAAAYCSWAGKQLCGSVEGGELPFKQANDPEQSQWVHACSAGGTQTYPYGNEWISDACLDPPELIFQKDPEGVRERSCCRGPMDNLFGLGGNVAEWIAACNGNQGPNDTCVTIGYGLCGITKNQPRDFKQPFLDPLVGFRCCAAPE